MNTKQLQFVTFEQAKRLEKLGFNRYIGVFTPIQWYDDNGNLHMDKFHPCTGYYLAPTIPLALKYIRDEKGIKNSVCLCKWSSTTDGSVRIVYQPCIDGKLWFEYNVYEAAESALLDKLLTFLEEERNENH